MVKRAIGRGNKDGSGARPINHGTERTSLHSHVVVALGQDIVDERTPPGEILSPEALCARFDVSRSVIRESLRALEAMGMVAARPHVGTRVLPMTEWNLFHPQIVEWRGRGAAYLAQMEEVLEMRFGIDIVASRLAVRRMTDDEVSILNGHVDTMTDAAARGDGSAYLDADAAFHRVLLLGSGNALIAQFAETIEAVLHTRAGDPRRAINALTARSLDNHRALASAVAARDEDAAEAASRRIVDETLQEFREAGQAQIMGS